MVLALAVANPAHAVTARIEAAAECSHHPVEKIDEVVQRQPSSILHSLLECLRCPICPIHGALLSSGSILRIACIAIHIV